MTYGWASAAQLAGRSKLEEFDTVVFCTIELEDCAVLAHAGPTATNTVIVVIVPTATDTLPNVLNFLNVPP